MSAVTKRIIPCLDIKDGQTVKGVNFVNLIQAGDPVELAQRYATLGADELVFLDITATVEGRKTFADLVLKIAKVLNIPFTVGGGLSSVEDVAKMLDNGADKISVNSSAIRNPSLIDELAKNFGSQCVVVAIDINEIEGQIKVFSHGGRKDTGIDFYQWSKEVVERGAGELLITSMRADGTKKGFDLEPIQKVEKMVNVPIIASGGAGDISHFTQLFTQTQATGALAASVFHFSEIGIPILKDVLSQQNIPVRR